MSGGWTKGTWAIDDDADYSVDRDDHDGLCASCWTVVSNAENHNFAIVIVDVNSPNNYNDTLLDEVAQFVIEAGTVANETGLTPRQLADQRAALLAACQAFEDAFLSDQDTDKVYPIIVYPIVRAAIANATGAL